MIHSWVYSVIGTELTLRCNKTPRNFVFCSLQCLPTRHLKYERVRGGRSANIGRCKWMVQWRHPSCDVTALGFDSRCIYCLKSGLVRCMCLKRSFLWHSFKSNLVLVNGKELRLLSEPSRFRHNVHHINISKNIYEMIIYVDTFNLNFCTYLILYYRYNYMFTSVSYYLKRAIFVYIWRSTQYLRNVFHGGSNFILT